MLLVMLLIYVTLKSAKHRKGNYLACRIDLGHSPKESGFLIQRIFCIEYMRVQYNSQINVLQDCEIARRARIRK